MRTDRSRAQPTDLLAAENQVETLRRTGEIAAPALAVLRARVVAGFLEHDDTVWRGMGFPSAQRLAETVVNGSLSGLSPTVLEELSGALGGSRARAIPSHLDADAARVLLERAHARVEAAKRDLETGILAGGSSSEGNNDDGTTERDPAPSLFMVTVPPALGRLHPVLADVVLPGTVHVLRVAAGQRGWSRGAESLSITPTASPETEGGMLEALAGLGSFSAPGAPGVQACTFRVRVESPPAQLHGTSATAAFQLAAAVARANLAPTPFHRRIGNGIAIIGSLEGSQVAPVSEESLGAKIEACFFSPVEVVFVPAAQEIGARQVGLRLQSRFPARAFRVVGVSRIEEIWENRAVVILEPRGLPAITEAGLARFAGSRGLVSALLVLVLLAAGLIYLEIRRSERTLSYTEWSESGTFTGYNRHDRPLFSVDLSSPPPGATDFLWRGARMGLVDLIGDDDPEAVAISCPEANIMSRLTAINASGDVLWDRSARGVGFPSDGSVEHMQWMWFRELPDVTGPSDLVTIRRNPRESLCLLEILDGETGGTLVELHNQGHLEGMYLFDRDGDGKQELYVPGTHNPSSMGLMVVLDPKVAREKPLGPATELRWLTEAAAAWPGVEAVLRFPLSRYAMTARPNGVEVFPEQDGSVLACMEEGGGEKQVLYYVDLKDPQIPLMKEVRFNDAYVGTLTGITPQDLEQERRRLMEGVEVLTPEGWRPVAVSETGSKRD